MTQNWCQTGNKAGVLTVYPTVSKQNNGADDQISCAPSKGSVNKRIWFEARESFMVLDSPIFLKTRPDAFCLLAAGQRRWPALPN
jgi:hypothetical protein